MKKILLKTFWTSISSYAIFLAVLVALEPSLVVAASAEDQFTISQQIASEIVFLTPATDITMNGTLAGITGGTSTGGTQVVVYTTDDDGYTMTIKASSSPAMQGNSQGGSIPDYTPVSGSRPDYTYSVPAGYEFGFTTSASTTSDLDQKFLDNGSNTCNTGSADTTGLTTCWMGLSTVATSTIVRTTETLVSGSTSTLYFQLTINNGSFVVEDTYVATSTLTITTN